MYRNLHDIKKEECDQNDLSLEYHNVVEFVFNP